jgi:autotransporter-associated beta strand protein
VRAAFPETTNPAVNAFTGTLRFDEAAPLTVTLSGLTVIEKGGILVTPNVPQNVGGPQTTITGGTLTAGGQELIVIQGSFGHTLRIESEIADFGGATSVTKAGPGTLELAGVNTFPGGLKITGGYLRITGSMAGDVEVAPGGAVGGGGVIGGGLKVGIPPNLLGPPRPPGTHPVIAPGRSPGVLTAGSIELADGIYEWEINDALGVASDDPGWDLLTAVGILDITATAEAPFTIDIRSLALTNLSGHAVNFDPEQDYSWVIASSGGGLSIGGTLIDELSDFSADLFDIERAGFTNTTDGTFSLGLDPTLHDLVLTYQAPVPSPEPSALLYTLGGVALLLRRRR